MNVPRCRAICGFGTGWAEKMESLHHWELTENPKMAAIDRGRRVETLPFWLSGLYMACLCHVHELAQMPTANAHAT